eukprot:CAMPEP_0185003334 /NCGR_PEP_ID=MMETSP1098-20130426/76252_1 /TAXON_ID=89044 /ORGANISM="Spumella elongata, Strain CCAP 955/1" /LENGTH=46 /DNA_ID= /DNA_START= /DNA_END= /DNA_ORIENTATION=
MLWAHTHGAAHILHVSQNVVSVDSGAVVTAGGIGADQTSQHADGGG